MACWAQAEHASSVLCCSGLETKLKHCLAGSNIFADVTPGVDPKHQVVTRGPL